MAKHPAVVAGAATKVTAWLCRCAKCGHEWRSSGEDPPAYCAGCHSAEWWIKRPRGRPRLTPKG